MESIFDLQENCVVDFAELDVDGYNVSCALYDGVIFVSLSNALNWASNLPSYKYKHLAKRCGKVVARNRLKNISNNWLRNSSLGKLVFIDSDKKTVEYLEMKSVKFLLEYVCDPEDAQRFIGVIGDFNSDQEDNLPKESVEVMEYTDLNEDYVDAVRFVNSDPTDEVVNDYNSSSESNMDTRNSYDSPASSNLSDVLARIGVPDVLNWLFKNLSSDDWTKVGDMFGRYLNPFLLLLSLSDQVTSMKELASISTIEEWFLKVPTALKTFIESCTKASRPRKRNKEVINRECNVLEALLKARNNNFCSPFDLQENTVNLTLTGSRLSSNLLGAACSGGGYSKVCRTLKSGAGKIKPRASKFSIDVIDNDGEFNKKYSLLRHHIKFCDVVTVHITMELKFDPGLLKDSSISPAEWFLPQLLAPDSSKLAALKETSLTSQSIFNCELKRIVDLELNLLLSKNETDLLSNTTDGSSSKEPASNSTRHSSNISKVEIRDGVAYVFTEHSDETGIKSAREQAMGHVKSSISGKASVDVRKIIFENPSSQEALTKVLLEVMDDAGYPKLNTTVIPFMDGSPYITCLGILENTFSCLICGQIIWGENDLNCHFDSEHPDNKHQLPKGVHTFKDVLLMSGPGHVYMNLQKAVLDVLWPIFGEDVAKCLGFVSNSAQNMIKLAKDTHITHEVLLVLRHSIMAELIEAYQHHLIDCDKESCHSKAMTFEGFMFFMESHIKDPNFMLGFELVSILLSIHILLLGIRRNNVEYYLCGLEVGGVLFFARKHPKYRAITMIFRLLFQIAPQEFQIPLKEMIGFSATGDTTRGEGADFILEGVNQGVRNLLPNGVSTENNWNLASINYSDVMQMKHQVFERLGYKDASLYPEDKIKTRDQYQERITVVRQTLGDHSKTPSLWRPLEGLSGNHLSSQMNSFLSASKNSFENFIDKVAEKKLSFYKISSTKSDIVPVTESEEKYLTSMESKTIPEIVESILKFISDVEDNKVSDALEENFKNFRKKNKLKSSLVEYYSKLPELESEIRYSLDISA